MPHVPEAERTYRRFMRRLDEVAADITALTQRGSLPFYLGGILLAVVVLPGGAMIRTLVDGTATTAVRAWDTPAQVVVGTVIVVAAVLAARARRRLKAVLLVGLTGYGTAVMFMFQCHKGNQQLGREIVNAVVARIFQCPQSDGFARSRHTGDEDDFWFHGVDFCGSEDWAAFSISRAWAND